MTRRTRRAPSAAAKPPQAPRATTEAVESAHDGVGGVELLEDRSLRIEGGRTGRRLGLSVPGAVAGTFLIVALAFGAGLRPSLDGAGGGHDGSDATTGQGAHGDGGQTGGGDLLGREDGDGYDKPDVELPGTAPESDASSKPDGETADEPAPVDGPDAARTMELGLRLDGSKVVVSWSMCDFDGFRYYKVVRSTDETVTWPLGDGDVLLGAFENVTQTSMVDSGGRLGRTYFYRVVAVRSFDGDYLAVCKSAVKSIKVPKPEPEPTSTPKPDGFSLSAWIAEGKPVMEWGTCGDVSFSKFKIVRSLDATVSWPTGENDTLIAATGPDDHKAWDADAPSGKKLYYRVFCVRSTESGYVAVGASIVAAVTTPSAEPPPDPVALAFEASLTGEGVALSWEACTSDSFAFYKVLRSTGPNPSYLPYTDGTQVIGVIENQAVAGLTDGEVASGQTWYYRVQSIGYWNGQKVLLGQTAAIAVTIP